MEWAIGMTFKVCLQVPGLLFPPEYDGVDHRDDFQNFKFQESFFLRNMMELAIGMTFKFASKFQECFLMELASRMSQNLQISPPPFHSPSENSKSQTKVEYAERGRLFASSYVGINLLSPASACVLNKSNFLKVITR